MEQVAFRAGIYRHVDQTLRLMVCHSQGLLDAHPLETQIAASDHSDRMSAGARSCILNQLLVKLNIVGGYDDLFD